MLFTCDNFLIVCPEFLHCNILLLPGSSACEDSQTEESVAGPVHSPEYFCTLIIHHLAFMVLKMLDKYIRPMKMLHYFFYWGLWHKHLIMPLRPAEVRGRSCSRCHCWCCYSGLLGLLTYTQPFIRHKFTQLECKSYVWFLRKLNI